MNAKSSPFQFLQCLDKFRPHNPFVMVSLIADGQCAPPMRVTAWRWRQNDMERIADIVREPAIGFVHVTVAGITKLLGIAKSGNRLIGRSAMRPEQRQVFRVNAGSVPHCEQGGFELRGGRNWFRVAVGVVFVILNIFFMGWNFKKPFNLISGIISAYNKLLSFFGNLSRHHSLPARLQKHEDALANADHSNKSDAVMRYLAGGCIHRLKRCVFVLLKAFGDQSQSKLPNIIGRTVKPQYVSCHKIWKLHSKNPASKSGG